MYKSGNRRNTRQLVQAASVQMSGHRQQTSDGSASQQIDQWTRRESASQDLALQTYLKKLNIKAMSVKKKAKFEDDPSLSSDLSLSEDSDVAVGQEDISVPKSPFLKAKSKPSVAEYETNSTKLTFANSPSTGSHNVSEALSKFIKFDKKYLKKTSTKAEFSDVSESDLEDLTDGDDNDGLILDEKERLKIYSKNKNDKLLEMTIPYARKNNKILESDKKKVEKGDHALKEDKSYYVKTKNSENKTSEKDSKKLRDSTEMQIEDTRKHYKADRIHLVHAEVSKVNTDIVKTSSMFSIHDLHTVEELLGNSGPDEAQDEKAVYRIQESFQEESSDEELSEVDKELPTDQVKELIIIEPSEKISEESKTIKSLFSGYQSNFHSSLFTGSKISEQNDQTERQILQEKFKKENSSRKSTGKEDKVQKNKKTNSGDDISHTYEVVKESSSNSLFKAFNLHTIDELQSGKESLDINNSVSHDRSAVKESLDVNSSVSHDGSAVKELQSLKSDTDTFMEESVAESSEIGSNEKLNSSVERSSEEVSSQVVRKYKKSPVKSESKYSDSSSRVTESKKSKQSMRTAGRKQKVKSSRKENETRNVGIQVEPQVALSYAWNPHLEDLQLSTAPSVDPAPIAKYTISAESLEVMTTYSPCMFALNELLRQQIQLTQHFLASQRHMYQAFCSAIPVTYHPVTVQETKEYIRRKKKPPLSFKKALKMVKKEMKEDS